MSDVLARASRAATELRETEAVCAGLRQAAFEQIAASAFEHTVKREKLYLFVQSIDTIRKGLQSLVDGGEVENYTNALAEIGLTRP